MDEAILFGGIRILVDNHLLNLLISQAIQYVLTEDRALQELLSTDEIPTDVDILTCYTAIQMTLILLWYGRDFDTPTLEMAKKFQRLIHEPLISVVG